MPVLNGFEVLDWIRQQPFAPSLRVVVLSGSDQEKDRQKAHALGALRYQVKPVKVQNLTKDLLDLSRELKNSAFSSAGQTQLADPDA
jgi:CheY-like chemotaxis protein